MLVKHGLLTAIGLILGLIALVVIEPRTAAGQTLLVAIVISITNGLGGLLWQRKKSET